MLNLCQTLGFCMDEFPKRKSTKQEPYLKKIFTFRGNSPTTLRKPIAILLLFCFALYQFGYYVAYFSFRMQIEKHWADAVYSGGSTNHEEKVMEIPLSIPYMASEEDFRTVNTKFEKDGQHFRVIKQRYLNDTLQVVYVPDTATRTLDQTLKLWVSSLVQDEMPDSGHNSAFSKIFIKDFTQPGNGFRLTQKPANERVYIGFIFSSYNQLAINIHTPPPEIA